MDIDAPSDALPESDAGFVEDYVADGNTFDVSGTGTALLTHSHVTLPTFSASFPLPFRVLTLIGLAILLWAINLHVLWALGIDTAWVLGINRDKENETTGGSGPDTGVELDAVIHSARVDGNDGEVVFDAPAGEVDAGGKKRRLLGLHSGASGEGPFPPDEVEEVLTLTDSEEGSRGEINIKSLVVPRGGSRNDTDNEGTHVRRSSLGHSHSASRTSRDSRLDSTSTSAGSDRGSNSSTTTSHNHNPIHNHKPRSSSLSNAVSSNINETTPYPGGNFRQPIRRILRSSSAVPDGPVPFNQSSRRMYQKTYVLFLIYSFWVASGWLLFTHLTRPGTASIESSITTDFDFSDGRDGRERLQAEHRSLIEHYRWVPAIVAFGAIALLGSGIWFGRDPNRTIANRSVLPSSNRATSSLGAPDGSRRWTSHRVLSVARAERQAVLSSLNRIFRPAPNRAPFFADVILADIITSFAKVLGDTFVSAYQIWSGGISRGRVRLHGLFNWIVLALVCLPYILRLRQCLAEYLAPTNTSTRPLANALKYASAFPVIVLSAMQKEVVKDIALAKGVTVAQLDETAGRWFGEHRLFRLWLLAVVVNSMYSFWWDVTNDWGLSLLQNKSNSNIGVMSPNSARMFQPQARVRTASQGRNGSSAATRTTLGGGWVIPSLKPSSFTRYLRRLIRRISSGNWSTPNPYDAEDFEMQPHQRSPHPTPYDSPQSPSSTSYFSGWNFRNPLHFGLRPILLFPDPLVYHVFIIVDFILRFTWSLKLSSHLHTISEIESGVFLMEALELVRRWMWVFLRIEWESVKKMDEMKRLAVEKANASAREASQRGIADRGRPNGQTLGNGHLKLDYNEKSTAGLEMRG